MAQSSRSTAQPDWRGIYVVMNEIPEADSTTVHTPDGRLDRHFGYHLNRHISLMIELRPDLSVRQANGTLKKVGSDSYKRIDVAMDHGRFEVWLDLFQARLATTWSSARGRRCIKIGEYDARKVLVVPRPPEICLGAADPNTLLPSDKNLPGFQDIFEKSLFQVPLPKPLALNWKSERSVTRTTHRSMLARQLQGEPGCHGWLVQYWERFCHDNRAWITAGAASSAPIRLCGSIPSPRPAEPEEQLLKGLIRIHGKANTFCVDLIITAVFKFGQWWKANTSRADWREVLEARRAELAKRRAAHLAAAKK